MALYQPTAAIPASVRTGLGSLYDYGARFYSSSLNRWPQPDTIVPQPGNPQSLNRYAYGLNNPVRYRDSSGHWVETAWDIANIAWDIYEVKNDPSVLNIGALVVDVGAAVLPFVPAGAGLIARGGKAAKVAVEAATHGDEVVDALRTAGHLGDGVHVTLAAANAVDTAKTLAKVGANSPEAAQLTRKLANLSTRGSGNRVVIGQWIEGAGYIAEA